MEGVHRVQTNTVGSFSHFLEIVAIFLVYKLFTNIHNDKNKNVKKFTQKVVFKQREKEFSLNKEKIRVFMKYRRK